MTCLFFVLNSSPKRGNSFSSSFEKQRSSTTWTFSGCPYGFEGN